MRRTSAPDVVNRMGCQMKVVVVGGTGLIGSKLVAQLRSRGLDTVPASRRTGVDAMTGAGVANALVGADVLVDVGNSSSFDEPYVSNYFRRSSMNLLSASKSAGVKHYVALSVVGTSRLIGSPYFNAKALQEQMVRHSTIRHTLVQATQFFEFVASIIPEGSGKEGVSLPPAMIRPIAADDVARLIADAVERPPEGATLEIAGPEQFRLSELVQWVMYAYQDDRQVVTDPDALYYGAIMDDDALVPSAKAILGTISFKDWLNGYLSGATPVPAVNIPRPI